MLAVLRSLFGEPMGSPPHAHRLEEEMTSRVTLKVEDAVSVREDWKEGPRELETLLAWLRKQPGQEASQPDGELLLPDVLQPVLKVPVRPTLTRCTDALKPLIERATSLTCGYQPPQFENYLRIEVEAERQAFGVAQALAVAQALDGLPRQYRIERAYLESPPVPMRVEGRSLSTRFRRSLEEWARALSLPLGPPDYLEVLKVPQVRGERGGSGDHPDLALVDVESGWDRSVLILDRANRICSESGESHCEEDHGAQVIQRVLAVAPKLPCLGLSSHWFSDQTGRDSHIPDAILCGLSALKAGQILLIELQAQKKLGANKEVILPRECDHAEFKLIELATRAGIVVVEPAGNGYGDLGDFHDKFPWWQGNSGAVMVGAAGRNGASWSRWPSSNHGKRVDCFAHGKPNPGDTSAAAAIIAGAAALIQAVAGHRKGLLAPGDLRRLLRLHGTTVTGQVGRLPDLEAIVGQLP